MPSQSDFQMAAAILHAEGKFFSCSKQPVPSVNVQ